MSDEPVEKLVGEREQREHALKMASVLGRWIFLSISVIFINLSVCANGNARKDAAEAEGYADGMRKTLDKLSKD